MTRTRTYLLLLTALLFVAVSCASRRPLRYMHPEQPIDTEYGYPGSQARIDVTGRVAASAGIRLDDDDGLLRTEVVVTNVANSGIRIYVGSCPVQIQAFERETLDGEPLWDSFEGRTAPCPDRETFRYLDPREDYFIVMDIRPELVLGDSLPDGRYYFNAIVRPNGIRMDLPAGEALVYR